MIVISYNDMYDEIILGKKMMRRKKEVKVRTHRNFGLFLVKTPFSAAVHLFHLFYLFPKQNSKMANKFDVSQMKGLMAFNG